MARKSFFTLFSKSVLFILLFSSPYSSVADSKLEDITDESLHQHLETEQHVIVLFLDSRNCDDSCTVMENTLISLRADLVDALGAWIVKTHDSPHLSEYGIEKAPAIVFFRQKNPMLYDGEVKEDDMYDFFTAFREKTYIKSLDDDNFEHLTQASTGATTGDWLVIFHTDQCHTCLGWFTKLETVAARHKQTMTVAKVNRDKNGAKTGRRFQAYEDPTLILFRKGLMHRFGFTHNDIKTLENFASRAHTIVEGEPVPEIKSGLEDTMEAVSHFCRENWILLLVVCASIVLFIYAASYSALSSSKKKKKSSKKKK